ncbi:MAG: DUF1549 and DUF1553 domain-containing protein [Planctomycetaceae bacterium]
MPRRCRLLVPCLFLLLGTSVASGDDSERAMSARVDALLAQSWKKAGVKPGPLAADAVFLRRAYLDLTGAIPTVGQVREFLDDTSPDKRDRLIGRLLGSSKPAGRSGSSRHATHLANVWQQVMLPQLANNIRFRFQGGTFNTWLRNHFADNTPYDKVVRELLTYTGPTTTGPGLYYQILEFKPEELAASSSRLFLGVQIQCAQCHNHPFDHWTQKDFWGYAAFFARIQRPTTRQRFLRQVTEVAAGEVKLPDAKTVVAPKFLGAKSSKIKDDVSRRRQVAEWLTSKENPYFAKATVNRVWALLFGYGLVNPVDDFGKHNPASHPQLLNELAADFVKHDYDLRRLFRVLARSRGYQLTSQVSVSDSYHPNLFHRMAVKSLNAGQIYDCLQIAMVKRENPVTSRFNGRTRFNQTRQAFVSKFEAPTQSATEFQAGIPQALTMMNGSFIAQATDVDRSDLLIAVADAPFMTDEQRVETLFLAVLSRKPTPKEHDRFAKYVAGGGPEKDKRKALGDVMWALLNSTEFILNH